MFRIIYPSWDSVFLLLTMARKRATNETAILDHSNKGSINIYIVAVEPSNLFKVQSLLCEEWSNQTEKKKSRRWFLWSRKPSPNKNMCFAFELFTPKQIPFISIFDPFNRCHSSGRKWLEFKLLLAGIRTLDPVCEHNAPFQKSRKGETTSVEKKTGENNVNDKKR